MIRQRNPNSATILSVRPIQEADLQGLREKSITTTNVKSLRDSHYMVARLFVLGLSNYEVAEATGYSYVRISTFRSDPAMMERVACLRRELDLRTIELGDTFQAQAISNMRKAERMLSDKLDDAEANGESLPVRDLVAITTDRMDRFGYGKKSMNVNVNVDFAKNLEAAIARSKKVAAE